MCCFRIKRYKQSTKVMFNIKLCILQSVKNHPTEYRSTLSALFFLSDSVVRENDYGSIVVYRLAGISLSVVSRQSDITRALLTPLKYKVFTTLRSFHFSAALAPQYKAEINDGWFFHGRETIFKVYSKERIFMPLQEILFARIQEQTTQSRKLKRKRINCVKSNNINVLTSKKFNRVLTRKHFIEIINTSLEERTLTNTSN